MHKEGCWLQHPAGALTVVRGMFNAYFAATALCNSLEVFAGIVIMAPVVQLTCRWLPVCYLLMDNGTLHIMLLHCPKAINDD